MADAKATEAFIAQHLLMGAMDDARAAAVARYARDASPSLPTAYVAATSRSPTDVAATFANVGKIAQAMWPLPPR
jgi:hypothetical protein